MFFTVYTSKNTSLFEKSTDKEKNYTQVQTNEINLNLTVKNETLLHYRVLK